MDCKGVHILFCDHDPSTGAETVALLSKHSYKVTAVKSARQVVEILNAENCDVDIVLADVELPQEKSFKMLKHILGQGSLSHVAVVVISERDDMAVVAKCLRLGAVDYLVKPLRSNEVMNLWTHMWRRRQMLGLPDKRVAIKHAELWKPDATVDLLASYCERECFTPAKDAHPTFESMDCSPPQLELSLKLSLNYDVERVADQAFNIGKLKFPDYAPMPASPVNERARNPSAFSVFPKSSNQQPDEQSATNVGSPSSQFSEKPRQCNNKESAERVSPIAHMSQYSPKDSSVGDENRPGDVEIQVCDVPQQLPMQSMATGERVLYVEQMPPIHQQQGFQPCYTYIEPCQDMGQSFSNAAQDGCAAAGYTNATLHSSPVQPLPMYHHEAGLTNAPAASNLYSYYPLTHLMVPVVNFSTWPPMVPSPPPVAGGKLIQAERREAALSKFRMKRKGRCFEKKIRYASRKKLAEQRPRVRGQFVKRAAVTGVVESVAMQGGFDEEEGEADDEQGCSELDNQSSPECIAESCRDG